MTTYEILCLIILIVTHVAMYHLGKASADPVPSDNAWLAFKCYTVDKQFEYQKWLDERENQHADETAEAAPSGD